MKKCSNCNVENEDAANFCSGCGCLLGISNEADNQGQSVGSQELNAAPGQDQSQQQNPYGQNHNQQQNPYVLNANQQQNPYGQNQSWDPNQQGPNNQYGQQGRALKGSLALGILSIVACGLNYLGIPVIHLVGIVFGIIAISYGSKGMRQKRELSLGALITGIVGLCMGIIAMLIGCVYALQTAEQIIGLIMSFV